MITSVRYLRTLHIDCSRRAWHTCASSADGAVAPSIDTAQTWVQVEVAESLLRAVYLESRETAMEKDYVVECSGVESRVGGIREVSTVRVGAVHRALVALAALDLNGAEKTAVCVALHRDLAEMESAEKLVIVQATAVVKGSTSARCELVLVKSSAPGLVAQAVVDLARMATPALWAEIRAVLAVDAAAEPVRE
jgi:hypothetical protein